MARPQTGLAERYGLESAKPSWMPDIIERYHLTPPQVDPGDAEADGQRDTMRAS